MSDDSDPIEKLLAAVSDGVPVDWQSLATGASPEHQRRLEALRELSHIVDFNRSLQRGAKSSGDATMPERWGDLLLLQRIGTGSQADVYRAWDPRLQREVALKLVRSDAAGSPSLLEEGRAAARIRHPNVVTMHGIDQHDGRIGLWMELVPGTTLEQEVHSRGPLEPVAVARLGIDIASALVAVHGVGVLHRDIKPANVVRDSADRWVLTDFGLGRRVDDATTPTPSGTPMYMAPELLASKPASEQSDIYSWGLLLWFALAGRHPFDMGSLEQLIAAVEHGPPSLSEVRSSTPRALCEIVEHAIAPAVEMRFARAAQCVDALAAWEKAPTRGHPAARRALWIAGIIAAVGLTALGTWRARQPKTVTTANVPPTSPNAVTATYDVEAALLRRDDGGATRLVDGDRVKPGDRLSLEIRTTRPAWAYVLNEDERGERYLLFPQPLFDTRNPLAADSSCVLPGPVGGKENAWTVTSVGGRETFLVVVSPEPVADLEATLGSLPAPQSGRPIEYAPVHDDAVERLRGVGGIAEVPSSSTPPARSRVFDRFRALAGRETEVRGIWVRQIVLENPPR